MPHHEYRCDAKHRDAILETRDNLGRQDIAGNAGYKDLAYRLIENSFDWDTRIGARQDRREGLLLLRGLLSHDSQVLP